jgi:hypothetical protein
MRRIGVLVLLLMLAGCAAKTGGAGVATADGKPSAAASSAPAAVDDKDAALKFSQCMREQGLTWFPDPQPGNGGLRIQIPPGQDKTKVDAAMAACKKFMPNGGEPPKLDAEALAQMRQFSKCMRENGVPNFPDPSANGQLMLDSRKVGMGPGDPGFDAASKTCAKYQPKPPNGGGDGPANATAKG